MFRHFFYRAVDALKECQEIFYDGHCTDAENVKKWMSDMHDLRHEPLLSELSCLDTGENNSFPINPLNARDALKHNFTSLKTDL